MFNLFKDNEQRLKNIDSSTLKMIHALPSSCSCPLCEQTKDEIKKSIGHKEYVFAMKATGKCHAYY